MKQRGLRFTVCSASMIFQLACHMFTSALATGLKSDNHHHLQEKELVTWLDNTSPGQLHTNRKSASSQLTTTSSVTVFSILLMRESKLAPFTSTAAKHSCRCFLYPKESVSIRRALTSLHTRFQSGEAWDDDASDVLFMLAKNTRVRRALELSLPAKLLQKSKINLRIKKQCKKASLYSEVYFPPKAEYQNNINVQ